MDASQPGLFDLPDEEPPAAPERSKRGRNRETWSCSATADVTIVDEAAIREAVALAKESGLVVDIGAESAVEDHNDEVPEAPDNDIFYELMWLIWPNDGLEEPLETGAFRLDSTDNEIVAESGDRGTLRWTVTVKLTDVDALRRLAAAAHPDKAGPIAADLAVAWQYAVDPFAPLREIPGIIWQPGEVNVQHVPRRHR